MPQESVVGPMSWDDFRDIEKRGYEFASHTVTHPYLSVLDDQHLQFELEKSRLEILEQLGEKHTFSIECPYGTEDPRAVQAALKIYSLTRNLMPDEGVQALDRWDEQDPGASTKTYVRWQRGAVTDTPIDLMKGWVDTIVKHQNIWLVLVFHGVDGIGWEPLPKSEYETYFEYLHSRNDQAWITTFQDGAKYIREKLNSHVSAEASEKSIRITLTHSLDPKTYDLPLTLRTYVLASWTAVDLKQGELQKNLTVQKGTEGNYVIYEAIPNGGIVELRPD
jgi:hypothetical protein